ncbi:hypothetical protein [Streptomyces sp. NPDC005336]|uniref:hypothetical protein n=1 Tax=Streptomyces sp. NPDC005336 TaxID=3157035 RepID=UPI0033BAE166
MSTEALPWTPPNTHSVQLLPAGKWWDAVRVPRALGEHALRLLGEATGAVIDDPLDKRLAWLIEPGTADQWDMSWLPTVELRDTTAYIDVPPLGRTIGPGVHWRVPITYDRYLTEPTVLYTVLRMATQAALGPREGGAR